MIHLIDFLSKLEEIYIFSPQEKEEFEAMYNRGLNEQLLLLSGLNDDEFQEISQIKDSPIMYKEIFSRIKYKQKFKTDFRAFVDAFHTQLINTLIESGDENQKKQLTAYLHELNQNVIKESH